MPTRLPVMLVMACWILTLSLCSAQEAPAREQPGDLDQLVARLDSADFDTREGAYKKLVELGRAAVPAVRKALQTKQVSPELESKAKLFLSLFDGGGEPVQGLKATLTTDKETLKLGDTFTLTTVLANLNDKPMKVYIGYSTSGVDVESGAAMHRLEVVREGEQEKLKAEAVKWQVGFCGTGAGPLFVVIPAKSIKTYTCEAIFARQPLQNNAQAVRQDIPDNPSITLGKQRYCFLPVTLNTEHRFCVILSATAEYYQARGFARDVAPEKDQQSVPAPVEWVGAMRSNEVKLTFSK